MAAATPIVSSNSPSIASYDFVCKYRESGVSLRSSVIVRFVTILLKTLGSETGERRGFYKSVAAITKEIWVYPELSAALFGADSIEKVFDTAKSPDKIRLNEFKDTLDKIKTYCNFYYFFETATKVLYKLKVHTFAQILTPLAWVTLIMDELLAFGEAIESGMKLYSNGNQSREWTHLSEKVTTTERKTGLPEEIKQDKIQKWKLRRFAHVANLGKTWLNVAFQINLMVMFVFLAYPLFGLSLGIGAVASSCIVAFLGLTKLAFKVAALTALDGLKPGREERVGHFRAGRDSACTKSVSKFDGGHARHPLDFSWNRHIPSRVPGAAAAAAF